MAGTRQLQLRMKSVQGTQQITRAMKLVSTAKLQKVRTMVEANKEYFTSIQDTVRSIVEHSGSYVLQPYMSQRQSGKDAYLLITSDRGLAGGYNSNVCRLAQEAIQNQDEAVILSVGHKGKEYFQRRGYTVAEEYKALEEIQKQLCRAVSQTLQMLIMLMQMKDDAMEALDIAQTYRKVESIFAVGGGMSAGLLMQQYMSMGRKKEALACLKEMADAATGKPMTPNPTLFYPTLEPKERRKDAGRELRAALLRGLKEDETLSGMRGEKE